MRKFLLNKLACVIIREESTAVGPGDESRGHGEHGHRYREGKANKETDQKQLRENRRIKASHEIRKCIRQNQSIRL
jgi:hypothetical protein